MLQRAMLQRHYRLEKSNCPVCYCVYKGDIVMKEQLDHCEACHVLIDSYCLRKRSSEWNDSEHSENNRECIMKRVNEKIFAFSMK